MAASRACLDTRCLAAPVVGGRDKRVAERALSRAFQPGFSVLVPQVALGEAAAVILRRYRGGEALHAMPRLGNVLLKYGADPSSCLAPPRGGAHAIAAELVSADTFLDSTDAAIVSHALADPDSGVLLTRDTTLLHSAALAACEERMRAEGRRSVRPRIKDSL